MSSGCVYGGEEGYVDALLDSRPVSEVQEQR